MRPDEETNQAFEYCLAVSAEKFGIEVLFTVAMSNHHHTGIHDGEGRYPEFLEYFHKLFAKCMNVHRGRWENFWSSEQTSVVRLADDEDALEKLVYAVTNPVKDHLVERVKEWPGVNSYRANRLEEEKVVKRPKGFFRESGPMPETAVLRFRRPRGFRHLSREEWAALLGRKVRAVEERAAEELRKSGRRALGRRAVLAQRWNAKPRSSEPRRAPTPRVAAKSVWRRIEALTRNRLFLKAYRAAREAIAAGYNFVAFPEGTYWMTRFMGVVCETRPCEELLAA
jgi:hypothetical protein